MALGAVDAYNALSLPREEYPLIYGVDGTAQGLSAVESGDLAGTVYNDEIRQSQALLSLALRLAKGESLSGLPLQEDKYIRIPYQRVRRENVEEFRREREERKSSFQTP